MRDSSIFYRSFYEAINDLPEENQLAVYKSIFEYTLNFNEIPLTGISKTIFTLIKPQLDANNKKFANGKKGGRPIEEKQTETKKEPKENQTESKPKTNENVNDNENEKENENKNNLPPTAFSMYHSLLDLGAEKDLINDWLKVRKNKKATNTKTAFNGFKSQFEKSNKDINTVLRLCIEKSWAGFNSEWITDNKSTVIEGETLDEKAYREHCEFVKKNRGW